MKIAIVHDILDAYGGAERVVQAMLDAFPESDLFVSRFTNNPQTAHIRNRFSNSSTTNNIPRQISADGQTHDPQLAARNRLSTTFMQHLPFHKLLGKFYTPFYPLAFESLDLTEYDVIISSTAHFAKGVLTTPEQLHVCYCHTPPRFLYHYPTESNARNSLILKPFVYMLDHSLRIYDRIAAQRPDFFLVNSEVVHNRVKKFHGREAQVIYPPVDTERFRPKENVHNDDYFIFVGRILPYKNIDTVINAFNKLPDRLLVVGEGGAKDAAMALAKDNDKIEFLGFVEEDRLISLLQKARGFIFSPSDEDFGITAVEAQAAGTAVIALSDGGAKETVVEGVTGVFYDVNSVDDLLRAVDKFKEKEREFNSDTIINHAARFSKERFIREVTSFVEKKSSKLNV